MDLGTRAKHGDLGEVLAGALGLPPPPRPGRAEQRESRTLRQAIRVAIDAYASRPFEIRVPGQHEGGISNQDLFAVLASQGRDFLDVNRAMVAYVIRTLEEALLAGGAVPTTATLKERATEAAATWARMRMSGEARDVRVRALTYRYALAKAKAGYGGQPVGVRTGDLMASLDRARIVFT